jgi:hypothetical protein
MLAEIIHPLPHGTVADAQFFGDFLLGTAVDENGAQGLVATMARIRGLAKKIQAKAVIHDPSSLEVSTILGDKPRKWYGQNAQLSL